MHQASSSTLGVVIVVVCIIVLLRGLSATTTGALASSPFDDFGDSPYGSTDSDTPPPHEFDVPMYVSDTAPLFAAESIMDMFLGGHGGGNGGKTAMRRAAVHTTEVVQSVVKTPTSTHTSSSPSYSSPLQRDAMKLISELRQHAEEEDVHGGGGGSLWFDWWLDTYEKVASVSNSPTHQYRHNNINSTATNITSAYRLPFGSLFTLTDLDRILDSTSGVELLADMNLKMMQSTTNAQKKDQSRKAGDDLSWAVGEMKDLQKLSQQLTRIYDLSIPGELGLPQEKKMKKDTSDGKTPAKTPSSSSSANVGAYKYRRHRHVRRDSVVAELARLEELNYRTLFSPIKARMLGLPPLAKAPTPQGGPHCMGVDCRFNILDYDHASSRIRRDLPAAFGQTAILGADVVISGESVQKLEEKFQELTAHYDARAYSRLIPPVRRLASMEGKTLILRDAEGRHPLLRYLSLFIKHIVFGSSVDVGVSVYYTPAPEGTQGGRCRPATDAVVGEGGDLGGGGGASTTPPLPERISNVKPHIDSMDVLAIAADGGRECAASEIRTRAKAKKNKKGVTVSGFGFKEEDDNTNDEDEQENHNDNSQQDANKCASSCLHKRWVLHAAAPHLHLPLKEYPTKEARGQPTSTLNRRLHYYNPTLHDVSLPGYVADAEGDLPPTSGTVTIVDPECGMELLAQDDTNDAYVGVGQAVYIPRGVIHSTVTSMSIIGSDDTNVDGNTHDDPKKRGTPQDVQWEVCTDKPFPRDPTSTTPSTFFGGLSDNGIAPFPGSIHLSVGIEPTKESRDGHAIYLNLIQSYIRNVLINNNNTFSDDEDDKAFGPFSKTELDIDAGSTGDTAMGLGGGGGGENSEDVEDDDGFIRVGGSGAGGGLRTEDPALWAARKRLLDSDRYTFPKYIFNTGHLSLLLLQSVSDSATSRNAIGLRKAVVIPPTDVNQKGRTSPITYMERQSQLAQWARHISVLVKLFEDLCGLYNLDCSSVALIKSSSDTADINNSPPSLLKVHPRGDGDDATYLKRWSKMILGGLLTRDFLMSNMDVWLSSSREYRSSILSTPSAPSNPVDGMGVDDPAFDVESFVGLLSGMGGVHGESVLYGKIGATPTSGTTAEELSASAGVAIKQWKMSRTGHLSSTTQRVSVMSRYALRAVRDLVQEAVNHVEHIMHTINNNSTSTSSPSSTAPLFVQRWRDNHMTIQARGNAAFRHWADLNEYLLLDHTHKNQFIDLSVAPMFRGKRGD